MRMRLITQLILVIVAVLIVIMYIQPRFATLQVIQRESVQFSEAVAKAKQFNDQLNLLLNQANTLTPAEESRLAMYLPFQIDTVAVARDLENLAETYNLTVLSIETNSRESSESAVANQESADFGATPAAQDVRDQLVTQTVSISVAGGYEDFKTFLQATEANAYPLQVTSLSLAAQTGEEAVLGTMQYQMEFAVYSLSNN